MKRRRWLILNASLLLGAYLLRTLSLDAQSFWLDEVYALWFIDRPFGEALHMIINPTNNGPLYFLLLWGWRRLTGPSDFALRYLSTLCSLITLPLLGQLVRRWFPRRVAATTLLLFTLSPFAIWYAQEAKMYALHTLLAVLSTYLLVSALERGRGWRWLGYGLTINLLGYSHFFGAFTIAAQGIAALLAPGRRGKSRLTYLITMAAVALPYLPVVRFALTILPGFELLDPSKHYVPLPKIFQHLALEFGFRLTWPIPQDHWLAVGVWLLVGAGLLVAWRRGWRTGLWLTLLLLLPPLLFYPLSRLVGVFTPKYFSGIFPIFLLLLALTVEAARRWRRPAAYLLLGGLVLLVGRAHLRDLTEPAIQRTDWRYVASYLEEHGSPEDAIVIYTDYMERVLGHYYEGPIPLYPYPYNPDVPEPLYEALEATGVRTLWLILHHDRVYAPEHRLIDAAAARYPRVTGQFPTEGQIQLFGFTLNGRHTSLPAGAQPLEATFENGLRLVGYEVRPTRLPPTEKVSHPPSNWIHVTTYWQAETAVEGGPFYLTGALVDAGGGVWGRELSYRPTAFEFDPPAGWPLGTIVEAHLDVNLNPLTPAGTYRLEIALEDEEGTRIAVEGEALPAVGLESIEILPPNAQP